MKGIKMNKQETTEALRQNWKSDRWSGITRNYTAEEVIKLRPSVKIEHSLAKHTAEKFWKELKSTNYIQALGTLTGAQAVNMVKAGLRSIYVSGWQVAADANQGQETYPDQSLYPSNSVPKLVERLQKALMRADQIEILNGDKQTDWYVPIIADAEAGFGGPLHAFELMKSMIQAGASGVHFEDQLASEKKCGHLGGKVLVPTSQFIKTLSAARLAADVCDVPSLMIARTDALSAKLMTSDIDSYDKEFLTGKRSAEGFYYVHDGLEAAISRGLAYAPYADLVWFETSTPDIKAAEKFAEAMHKKYPNKLLSYNCSPSFNWSSHLSPESIASFQRDLGQLGYRFQFITLAGWHLLNYYTFDLAKSYAASGMTAYVDLQEKEFARVEDGYTAVRHQQEAGTGYFDKILSTLTQGNCSTSALKDSTEWQQFKQVDSNSQPLT